MHSLCDLALALLGRKMRGKKRKFSIFIVIKFIIHNSMINCITAFFVSHSHLHLNEENFKALFGIGLQTMLFTWSVLQRIENIEEMNVMQIIFCGLFIS